MPDPPFEFFFDLMQAQRPPTEKVLKFNLSFHDSVKKYNKTLLVLRLLNFRTRMILKSTVVIFQASETSAASLTSVASETPLASTASRALFLQKTS